VNDVWVGWLVGIEKRRSAACCAVLHAANKQNDLARASKTVTSTTQMHSRGHLNCNAGLPAAGGRHHNPVAAVALVDPLDALAVV